MRRLFLYLIAAILVIGALRAIHHGPPHPHYGPPPPPPPPHHHRHRESLDVARKAADEARRALVDAGHEVRHALREAGDEVREAYREARAEIRRAYHVTNDDLPLPPPPPEPPAPPRLEDAEGLPVPIVPGTRVTDAEASPPQAVPARLVSQTSTPSPSRQEVAGEICATEDRARADARRVLRFRVAEWLGPEVPATWEPPAPLLESMIVATRIEPFVRDYGRLYTATLTVDFSPAHRQELIAAHERERVHDRLTILAGILAFILLCLAAISGYIRADEATKGYYTNHLRMLAAAGVGAAGVVVYRMLA